MAASFGIPSKHLSKSDLLLAIERAAWIALRTRGDRRVTLASLNAGQKERVLAALNHQEPDRPAVDCSGHRSSGMAAIAYARLRKHRLTLREPQKMDDLPSVGIA